MNQEKIGKFIYDLRRKYNLTQKQLADKLSVTAQAVSKWENGRGVPDIEILKKLSEEFNVSITELIEGEESNNKKKFTIYIGIAIIILTIASTAFGLYVSKDQDSFDFSSLTCANDSFNIEGVIAYNNTKKSIYISDIEYCGEDEPKFIAVECILYEKHQDDESIVAKYGSINKKNKESYNISNYLKEIRFNINNFSFNNYSCTCDSDVCNNMYIKINGLTINNEIITYDIPIVVLPDCK